MAAELPDLGQGELPSPLGSLFVIFAGPTLLYLDFADDVARTVRLVGRRFGRRVPTPQPVPKSLAEPIAAYFGGEFASLPHVPCQTGGTAFQRQVWRALRDVPPGTTCSYGALGEAVGRPKSASRAVGAAVGGNPISIVIPCHRIVGGDGRLTGYAGGLERKRWLLVHEGVAA